MDDIKELITYVIEDLFKKHQDKIEKKVNDKMELLKQENRELKTASVNFFLNLTREDNSYYMH